MGIIDRVLGDPWGRGIRRPERLPPVTDARMCALEALGDYVAEIVFAVPDPPGPPKAFRLQRERIFEEWPDGETVRAFPSVEFLPGIAEKRPQALQPYALEDSMDRFGEGTVLVVEHEHFERIGIEILATTRSQRSLLVAGIEAAMRPAEAVGSLWLRTKHYGMVASFDLVEGQTIDEEDSARRRRRSHLTVEMSIDVVRLTNAVRFKSLRADVVTVTASEPLPQIGTRVPIPRRR